MQGESQHSTGRWSQRQGPGLSNSQLLLVIILPETDTLFLAPKLVSVLLPLLSWAPGHDGKRDGWRLVSQGLTIRITLLGITNVPDSLGISKTNDLLKHSEQRYKMTQIFLRFIDQKTKVQRVMNIPKSKSELRAGAAVQPSSQSSSCGAGPGESWCWKVWAVWRRKGMGVSWKLWGSLTLGLGWVNLEASVH